jgi:hypothetical protein
MSCCCPPAIAAIFCLWVRNGFSKACVAGALTFFPPDPPLYKFSRLTKEGEILEDDGISEDGHDVEDDYSDEDDSRRQGKGVNGAQTSNARRRHGRRKKGHHPDEDLEPKSAMAALTGRQKQLERMAKKKLVRDRSDFLNGITYQFVVEESLCPPRFSSYLSRMEAVKLYNKKAKSYIAVVLYRALEDGDSPSEDELKTKKASETSADNSGESINDKQSDVRNDSEKSEEVSKTKKNRKTIIYSHGNATDIGGMSLMQCYLARGLDINVVMYDYSGYGESGGTPLESNTYSDIETVFAYVLENVADNNPNNIIIYGQSVGSGPSCYLCSRKPTGGMVLHSPFMSGIRVLTPSR